MALIPKNGNDKIYTPLNLAKKIVEYYKPSGIILEPCAGDGSFLKFLPPDTLWCEIDKGIDFFDFNTKVDWIITNPPYSIMRKFLQHCYNISDNIVLLVPLNHIIGLKARINDMRYSGFGIKEVLLIKTPKSFPQSGFQFSVVYIKKGHNGGINIVYNWEYEDA